MMRSMFSGVSGLRVHQTKMDVIANNIANVNTVGYKSSRMTFAEVFSQTLSGASGANAATGRGGTNAMQIGLGVGVSSISMLMTTGATQRTDNPYDLYIEGDGFFVVSDNGGTYFTRAGNYSLDKSGFLVNPEGMVLNGWKAVRGNEPGTYDILKTGVQPIQISNEDEYIEPELTTLIRYDGNLNAIKDGIKDSTISFFDSLGNKYLVDVRFEYNDSSKDWMVSIGNYMYLEGDKDNAILIDNAAIGAQISAPPPVLPGVTPPVVAGVTLTPQTPSDPKEEFAFQSVGSIKFGTDGKMDMGFMSSMEFAFDLSSNVLSPESEFNIPIKITFSGMTQTSGNTTAGSETVDGRKPGTLNGISIGQDGIITGRYSNGLTKPLWQIPLAQFKNPAGLEKAGSNLFISTPNSGDFDGVGIEIGDGVRLLAGVLEMANVDLASEFTEMITTQRGFQANSRVITTSDEMLVELVNLKR